MMRFPPLASLFLHSIRNPEQTAVPCWPVSGRQDEQYMFERCRPTSVSPPVRDSEYTSPESIAISLTSFKMHVHTSYAAARSVANPNPNTPTPTPPTTSRKKSPLELGPSLVMLMTEALRRFLCKAAEGCTKASAQSCRWRSVRTTSPRPHVRGVIVD